MFVLWFEGTPEEHHVRFFGGGPLLRLQEKPKENQVVCWGAPKKRTCPSGPAARHQHSPAQQAPGQAYTRSAWMATIFLGVGLERTVGNAIHYCDTIIIASQRLAHHTTGEIPQKWGKTP